MKSAKNVLLITYYWPPSGGAGVQRWLKFVKYFAQHDVNCTVITVDPAKASYPVQDSSLSADIPKNFDVHYTNTSEPYKYYKKFFSKSGVPHAGFANESNPSFFKKVTRFIRGNFFIPDARVGWNKFAYRKACELILHQDFDAIFVTSPPHSSQLVGLKLKKKFDIDWIADMRDPWTDIYYYDKMLHTDWAKKKDLKLEKAVFEKAKKVIVVSDDIKRIFESKVERKDFVEVIPNGYDHEDFETLQIEEKIEVSTSLNITYTGTISGDYPIHSFITGLNELEVENSDLKFVGIVAPEIKEQLTTFNSEFPGYVSHDESLQYLMSSDALLLIIPKIKNNKGILTGKLFEYIGSRKPIIMIGPKDGDAAAIIAECGAGRVFDYDDAKGVSDYLTELHKLKQKGDIPVNQSQNVSSYSREALTMKIIDLI